MIDPLFNSLFSKYIQEGSSAKMDYGRPIIDIFLAASDCKFAALKVCNLFAQKSFI